MMVHPAFPAFLARPMKERLLVLHTTHVEGASHTWTSPDGMALYCDPHAVHSIVELTGGALVGVGVQTYLVKETADEIFAAIDALLAPPPLTVEQQAELAVEEERRKRSRDIEEQMQDAMAAFLGPNALRAFQQMFSTYFDRTGGLDSPADAPAPPPPGDDVDVAASRERPDAAMIREALEHAEAGERVQIEQHPEPPPRDAVLDTENAAHGKYGCIKLASAPFWMHVPGCPDYYDQEAAQERAAEERKEQHEG